MSDRVVLTPEPLDPIQLVSALGAEEHGALVTFAGIVRRREGEQRLRAIDYQAYDAMAQKALDGLLDRAHQRWGEFEAVVAHRLGEVPVGEPSVWIGVSCGHRAECFEIARFLIDELKKEVPIWKRDHLPEG